MTLFTSTKEKRLWLWALAVFAAIISTLFIGRPLASQLRNQNVQAIFFMLGMLLIAIAVLIHAWKSKPSKIELSILLGIIAVYVMFIFRLGAPERSHLIEYSVLTIIIHKALIERARQANRIRMPALFAWVIAFLIGVLDESIQIILPNRVFDPQDILFNGIAVTMAIIVTIFLVWMRRKFSRSK
ncbi:VanZ family protein [Ekhidna sp.]|uniref:VanZ family protein n=1 Tax=Ekhidna sp. TaxID=2608089 RepID=UPI003298FBDD